MTNKHEGTFDFLVKIKEAVGDIVGIRDKICRSLGIKKNSRHCQCGHGKNRHGYSICYATRCTCEKYTDIKTDY